jgi:hypothetical protein
MKYLTLIARWFLFLTLKLTYIVPEHISIVSHTGTVPNELIKFKCHLVAQFVVDTSSLVFLLTKNLCSSCFYQQKWVQLSAG